MSGARLERNPAERTTRAARDTPAQFYLAVLFAARDEFSADGLHGLRMQGEPGFRRALGVPVELVRRRDPALALEDTRAQLVAVAPRLVHVVRQLAQGASMPALQAEPEDARDDGNRFGN